MALYWTNESVRNDNEYIFTSLLKLKSWNKFNFVVMIKFVYKIVILKFYFIPIEI